MNGTEPQPRAKYKRPPIQEAVCDIRFSMPRPLDKAEIERMQTVWKLEYPNQQVVTEKSFEVHLAFDKVDTKSTSVGHKLIARSADGKDLTQLGPKYLAVNRLNPYLGWVESFRDTILARLRQAQELYALKAVERVGLRYINKIVFPETNFRWSEWFVVSLPVPGGLGDSGGNFQFHFEQRLAADVRAIINFLSLPTPPDSRTSVILDIDISWQGKEDIAAIAAILEEVHDPHHILFEGYLLDKTRDLFHTES